MSSGTLTIYYDKKAGARVVHVDGLQTMTNCESTHTYTVNNKPFPGYCKGSIFKCSDFSGINFDYDISKIENGTELFQSATINSINCKLPKLKQGYMMFANCSSLTTFDSNLSSLTNGDYMFYDCNKLTTFECDDLSSLTNGFYMFYNCTALTTFTTDLSSLTDGTQMFYRCSNLKSFTSELSSLDDGMNMFLYCKNLITFDSDLNSLTDGTQMFYGCEKLETFSSDLISSKSNKSSLTNGRWMFYCCSNLTTFDSDLGSLTNGTQMFYGCSLDGSSVEKILSTIPTYTDGNQHIIDLTMNEQGCQKLGEILSEEIRNKEIPYYQNLEDDEKLNCQYKGWTIRATTKVKGGFYVN